MTERNFARALRLMVIASAALALIAIEVKALAATYRPAEIVFLRSLVHLALLAPVLAFRRVRLVAAFSPVLIARGLLGFAGVLCLFSSLRQLPMGVAILIAWTAPVFTMLFSTLLTRERLTRPLLLSMLLTMAGLLVFTDLAQATAGLAPRLGLLAIAVLGAASGGISYAVLKKADPGASPHAVAFYFSLVALVASAPLVLGRLALPQASQLGAVLLLGAGACVYQYCVARAYQLAPATRIAPLGLLTPIFGGVLDRAIFGQVFAGSQLVGAGLVLLGISVVVFRK